jgi:hypothetical protein
LLGGSGDEPAAPLPPSSLLGCPAGPCSPPIPLAVGVAESPEPEEIDEDYDCSDDVGTTADNANDFDSEDEGLPPRGKHRQWRLWGKPSEGNDSGKGSTGKVSKHNASSGKVSMGDVSKGNVSGKGFVFGKASTGKYSGKGSMGRGKQKIR